MKKIVMLLAAVAIAASPALAQEAKKEPAKDTKQSTAAMTKHKKKKMTKEEKEAADIAQQHDNTRRAVRDALPLVLPSWSLPIFFGTHMDEKLHKM